ncbi:MAG: hypothetical protein KAI83_05560 [Thiomargarita sp.]|nr:hypothetical protein [Thiomargarita sp.]
MTYKKNSCTKPIAEDLTQLLQACYSQILCTGHFLLSESELAEFSNFQNEKSSEFSLIYEVLNSVNSQILKILILTMERNLNQ